LAGIAKLYLKRDDNLGFWAASDQIVSFWKYRVIATKDNNTAKKN
jgi:hypothetical protein